MTMQEIIQAEESRTLPRFTHEDAWSMGLMARALCRERALSVSVSVEKCGQIVFQCAMEGTAPDNDRWMEGKRAVVRLTHHSSLYTYEKLQAAGKSQRERMFLDDLRYYCVGGSVPICVAGVGVIGSLTVSGLSSAEDHTLAMEILERYGKTLQAI